MSASLGTFSMTNEGDRHGPENRHPFLGAYGLWYDRDGEGNYLPFIARPGPGLRCDGLAGSVPFFFLATQIDTQAVTYDRQDLTH